LVGNVLEGDILPENALTGAPKGGAELVQYYMHKKVKIVITNRAAMLLASSSSEFILLAKKKTLS
jgi:hypothetical protein